MGLLRERSGLGKLLVEMQLVEEQALKQALSKEDTGSLPLGRVLSQKRLIDEPKMISALSRKLGLEVADIENARIHPQVVELVPGYIAAVSCLMPVGLRRTAQSDILYVAMSDPLDYEAMAEVKRASGKVVKVLIASARSIDNAIETYYNRTISQLVFSKDAAVSKLQDESSPRTEQLLTVPSPGQAMVAERSRRKQSKVSPSAVLDSVRRHDDRRKISSSEEISTKVGPKPAEKDSESSPPASVSRVREPTPKRNVSKDRDGSPPPLRSAVKKTRHDSEIPELHEGLVEEIGISVGELFHPGKTEVPEINQFDEPTSTNSRQRFWIPEPVTTELLVRADLDRSDVGLSSFAASEKTELSPLVQGPEKTALPKFPPYQPSVSPKTQQVTRPIGAKDNGSSSDLPTQDFMGARQQKIDQLVTLELSLDFEEDGVNPFSEQPKPSAFSVGLEHTAIIPAVKINNNLFDPPKPDPYPGDTEYRRALLDGDIPASNASVRARQHPWDEQVPQIEAEPISSSDADFVEVVVDSSILEPDLAKTVQAQKYPLVQVYRLYFKSQRHPCRVIFKQRYPYLLQRYLC